MLGYTGSYKGKPVTVFGSGMGQPSIGIYSYELFNFYGVDNIIRIGSAGSYSSDLAVYDTVLVTHAYSESTFAKVAFDMDGDCLPANDQLNNVLRKCACDVNVPLKEAIIHSSDVFYHDSSFSWEKLRDEHGCKAVEMESFALFANAIASGKKAACLLTISDSFITHEVTSSEERQNSFTNMMKVPPGRYILNTRINRSCALLETTDHLLSDIALEVGFCDQSHFIRTFKKIRGLTPSAYRRHHRSITD